MAQNPDTTEYDGMPRSAIATGLVDYVLPPAEMPAQLIAYVSHAFGKKPRPVSAPTAQGRRHAEEDLCPAARPDRPRFLPVQAEHPHPPDRAAHGPPPDRAAGRLSPLSAAEPGGSGGPLSRPPDRRHQLLPRPGGLRRAGNTGHPAPLRRQAGQAAPVRVWVCGCSTGEEAYSIAILIQEHLETLKQTFKVQIFATDIDRQAIEQARSGVFPASIAADVSPERLARFFTQDAGGRHLSHPEGHPRSAGLFRAGRDQGPALLQAGPDQLPQPADLSERRAAKEAHPAVPLRLEPGGRALPGHLRDRRRIHDALCPAGPQMEALSAPGGRPRRAPP